jgi:hypothetical protein
MSAWTADRRRAPASALAVGPWRDAPYGAGLGLEPCPRGHAVAAKKFEPIIGLSMPAVFSTTGAQPDGHHLTCVNDCRTFVERFVASVFVGAAQGQHDEQFGR